MNSTPSTLTDDLGRSLREALVKRLRGDDPDYPDDGLEAANWIESLEVANVALTVRIAGLQARMEAEKRCDFVEHAEVARALKYVIEVRGIKCEHRNPAPDDACAKCVADAALHAVTSNTVIPTEEKS